MPSQPIVTWITPCSSRSVKLTGTRTRRHTIGLMPTSQTLSCRTTSTFTAASGKGSTAVDDFSRRFIRPDYRLPAQPFQGTPEILMLPQRRGVAVFAHVPIVRPGQLTQRGATTGFAHAGQAEVDAVSQHRRQEARPVICK